MTTDNNRKLTTIFPNGETVERQMTDSEYAAFVNDRTDNFERTFWNDLRNQRDALLAASDWTQTADAPVDTKAWAAYRQALRDLPATIKDPTRPIDWPTPPN